jgi:hypothetical protein
MPTLKPGCMRSPLAVSKKPLARLGLYTVLVEVSISAPSGPGFHSG